MENGPSCVANSQLTEAGIEERIVVYLAATARDSSGAHDAEFLFTAMWTGIINV
jgi:hypothetical protein